MEKAADYSQRRGTQNRYQALSPSDGLFNYFVFRVNIIAVSLVLVDLYRV